MKRRTALLSGFAAISGAFVPRLFRRGLPAPANYLPVTGTTTYTFPLARFVPGQTIRIVAHGRIRCGQLLPLRPDGTVGPAT